MKKSTSLAVIGGDMRQAFLAQLLCADGHQVTVSALDRHNFDSGVHRSTAPDFGISGAEVVILPMPAERDESWLNAPLSNTSYHMLTILDTIPPGMLVLAGAVSDAMRTRAAQNKLHLIDYLKREELAIRNAVPTAEGAIQLAMEELPITLQGARILVIGNGRIGGLLAAKLRALGSSVFVSARSARDFARIEAAGHQALDTRFLGGSLAEFDLVVNTVPARVLGASELAELPVSCLILDLASKPGGADGPIGLHSPPCAHAKKATETKFPWLFRALFALGSFKTTLFAHLNQIDCCNGAKAENIGHETRINQQ